MYDPGFPFGETKEIFAALIYILEIAPKSVSTRWSFMDQENVKFSQLHG